MCKQDYRITDVVQFFHFIVSLNIREMKSSALLGHTMNRSELTRVELPKQCVVNRL